MTPFSEISQRYNAFLCDLWGVIHDGDELYPGVLEALEALAGQGKKLVFLSNAPRSADSVSLRMDAMGVKREWYHGAITSGEAAMRFIQSEALAEAGFTGEHYYYLGLEKDAEMLEALPQRRVASLAQADWLLNGNFEQLGQSYAQVEPILREAAALGLPMLCINPDLEVTKLDGTQIHCAGYLAEHYRQMGGAVEYIGKPHPYIYEMGMEMLGHPQKTEVLMIGDNVLTDIKGGNDFGIDTAFVTQGILQNQKRGEESAEDFCRKSGVSPQWIIPSL